MPNRETKNKGQNIAAVISQIYSTLLHLPERIQAICWVQFWSWIGWFPFLFYGSTWVGEIYLRYEVSGRNPSQNTLDEVGQQGSRALIVYSIVGTIAAIVLPGFIQNPGEDERHGYTIRSLRFLGTYLNNIKWRKPTLLKCWALANLLFASSMIFAPLVQSVAFATVLMALCGIPNAIGGLAAVTFLGVEVNRMSAGLPMFSRRRGSDNRKSVDSDIELEASSSRASSPHALHLRHDSNSSIVSTSTGELSGIYLGILNIYTTLPQFVGTGISWIVFSILEPGKSPELAQDLTPDERQSGSGVSAIGVCLFIGALSAVGAAWATRRLKNAY